MRVLAAVLLVANLLFFAWSRGWLDDAIGVRARGDREPERLARQVRPEAVQVLTPAEAAARAAATASSTAGMAASQPASAAAPLPGSAASAGTAASAGAAAAASPTVTALAASPTGAALATSSTGAARAATAGSAAPAALSGSAAVAASAPRLAAAPAVVCLEAGPFDTAAFAGARTAVRQLLPTVRWADVPTAAGGAWIVYMGAYANREAQARKEDELRRIRVGFEEVTVPPALQWGLSLGRFDNRAAAEAALVRFTQRGIRTARIVEAVPPLPAHRLRVEPLDPAQAAALLAMPAAGATRRFVPCAAG